jgi:hypothetical protein
MLNDCIMKGISCLMKTDSQFSAGLTPGKISPSRQKEKKMEAGLIGEIVRFVDNRKKFFKAIYNFFFIYLIFSCIS